MLWRHARTGDAVFIRGSHERAKVQKSILISIVGAAIIAGAIGASVIIGQEQPAPPSATQKPDSEITEITPPTFDVVRVNHEGNAVMAGRAHPSSTIEVLDNEKVFGTVKTDTRGEWVFVPAEVLEVGEHKLGLRMLLDGHDPVLSDHIVLMRVPERGKDALALKVRRDGTGPSEVLQKPGSGKTEKTSQLAIDNVDYGNGRLSISGRADPGSIVQLYVDNNFIGRTKTDEKGRWTLIPKTDIAPGNYQLRADQIDKNMKVAHRVEIPFQRAELSNIPNLQPGSFVVVQPGNSLWRLALRTYGKGLSYHEIFEENSDQIKDANLIYPGQVLRLPNN